MISFAASPDGLPVVAAAAAAVIASVSVAVGVAVGLSVDGRTDASSFIDAVVSLKAGILVVIDVVASVGDIVVFKLVKYPSVPFDVASTIDEFIVPNSLGEVVFPMKLGWGVGLMVALGLGAAVLVAFVASSTLRDEVVVSTLGESVPVAPCEYPVVGGIVTSEVALVASSILGARVTFAVGDTAVVGDKVPPIVGNSISVPLVAPTVREPTFVVFRAESVVVDVIPSAVGGSVSVAISIFSVVGNDAAICALGENVVVL